MDADNKVALLGAVKDMGKQMMAEMPQKVSDLDNDAGYQTGEQVTAVVNAKLSSTYRAGGSAAFSDLPELTEAHLGLVVNVTDKFTTTDSFLEGAGQEHPAGTNVAVVQAGKEYKYDVLAGFVDTSGLVEKEAGKGLSTNDYTDEDKAKLDGIEVASAEDVAAMLAEVFGPKQSKAGT